MKKKLLYILIIISLFSCDIVEEPFIEGNNPGIDTTENKKIILIEDFTGHKCGNCPRGHETIKSLIDMYPGQIVAVSIHCGYFSVPDASGPYTYDFRTDIGNELGGDGVIDMQGYYGIQEYPAGLVNSLDKSMLQSNTQWPGSALNYLQKQACIDISITNNYTNSNRKLSTKIKLKYLIDMQINMYLTVYLIEDSIIAYQKDYEASPKDIPDYVHMHVLRAGLNGTWGENISTQQITGNSDEKNYNITLDSLWNPEQCKIVAFIYDLNSKEVLQAACKKIK